MTDVAGRQDDHRAWGDRLLRKSRPV